MSDAGWGARGRVGAVVLVLACALTACSSPAQAFDQAAEQGVAATGTAELVIRQDLDGRTFDTTAVATLGDARTELVDATSAVARTAVTTAADAADRTHLLDLLAECLDAVDAATDAVQGGASADARDAQLDDAMQELERLGGELEDLAGGGSP